MARAPVAQDGAPEVDAIDGVALPRERADLFGQGQAEATLLDAYRSGRIHHAWILGGPKGIGKATLAFRFARFALSYPDPAAVPAGGPEPLPADPRVAAQVATGAHPNLLHLRRPYDERAKKVKTQLTVDEVRRTVGFFGNAAGSAGYRIAIVDAADDMNASAANALLKMLEEPPKRSLFLVLSHAPGRLLPTIRSRCRRLPLAPLGPDDLFGALDDVGIEVADPDRPALAGLAEGSVRRAIECLELDGLALDAAFRALVAGLPSLDRAALHRFADAVAGRKGADNLDLAVDLARGWLGDRLRLSLDRPASELNAIAGAWEEVGRIAAETDGLNLDRRLAVISLIESLAGAVRL